MGSTGSGSFTDYSGAKNTNTTGGGGTNGGASGIDKCKQAFACVLQEVAQCAYYAKNGAVPSTGTVLTLTLATRVFAVDATGATIGALPTSLNYLAACLADGVTYVGVVKSSALLPVPTVEADFAPQ